MSMESKYNLLLCIHLPKIIHRVGEYVWIDVTKNTISTLQNNTMPVGLQELFIQQHMPHLMHKLFPEMGEEMGGLLCQGNKDQQ